MCGIAGYNTFESADQSQLKTLAALLSVEMETRGRQSWGIFDATTMSKGVGAVTDGLVLPAIMPNQFVVHTRHATHGGVTVANAHPFELESSDGPMVGCHNGIISNHEDLNREYGRKFSVDSQHIFRHIADGRETLNDLQGYGAVVYRWKGQWFFGTFNHGDLNVANTEIGKVFASTHSAVLQACHMAGVKIHSWDDLVDNTVYSFDANTAQDAFEITAHGTHHKWNSRIDVDEAWASTWLASKKKEEREAQASLKMIAGLPVSSTPSTENETLTSPNYFAGSYWDQTLGLWVYGRDVRRPILLPPPPPKDPALEELECAECCLEIVEGFYYKNAEDKAVCVTCSQTKYQFIAEDDYNSFPAELLPRHDVDCDLCGAESIDPVVQVPREHMYLCKDCFAIHFTTKGLTKVRLDQITA